MKLLIHFKLAAVTLASSLAFAFDPVIQSHGRAFVDQIFPGSWVGVENFITTAIHLAVIYIAWVHHQIFYVYQSAICGSALIVHGLDLLGLSRLFPNQQHHANKIIKDVITVALTFYALRFQASFLLDSANPIVQQLLTPAVYLERLLK